MIVGQGHALRQYLSADKAEARRKPVAGGTQECVRHECFSDIVACDYGHPANTNFSCAIGNNVQPLANSSRRGAVHICIGSVYAWSTFNRPIHALFPNDPWWFSPPYTTFTTALVLLGLSAAFGGPWVERRGPRVAATAAAVFFGTGLIIGGIGLALRQSVLVFLGMGVIGGIGCGLGYIAPVSTLVKWFPDRRGMATGMAIMGFGGGAFLAGYLNVYFMDLFGVASTVMASGRRLLRRHDDRRAPHPPAAGGLEAGGLDSAGAPEQDDHESQLHAEPGDQDRAVLPAVGHFVHQCDGRHRHSGAGFAHDAGHVPEDGAPGRGRGFADQPVQRRRAILLGVLLRLSLAAAIPTLLFLWRS